MTTPRAYRPKLSALALTVAVIGGPASAAVPPSDGTAERVGSGLATPGLDVGFCVIPDHPTPFPTLEAGIVETLLPGSCLCLGVGPLRLQMCPDRVEPIGADPRPLEQAEAGSKRSRVGPEHP